MSIVTFSQVTSGPLADLTLELDAGLHVMVGAEHDGTLELVRLATGALSPKRGSVRVADEDPYQKPEIRRKIATSLVGDFEERTVKLALERRLALQSGASDAKTFLARAGLEHLLLRPAATLTETERFSIVLALVLDAKDPIALVLHQPFDAGTVLGRGFVLTELRRHAQTTPVLCTTARPELVSELSDTALWLESGRLRRRTSPTTAPAVRPGVAPTLVVTSSDAPKLARALASETSVLELRYVRKDGMLEVRGEQLEPLCMAVCRSARRENIRLYQMTQHFPELPEVRAVHAAMARTAYERAYGLLGARLGEGTEQ